MDVICRLAALTWFTMLAACVAPTNGPGDSTAIAPPDAPPGTCWGKATTPAIVETVTEQTLIEPAARTADGTVLWPAVYQTETRQEIVAERKTRWIETPCPPIMTSDFVASLQRALKARQYYAGPATGEIDAPTRTAIRLYQADIGVDSDILSLKAAQSLGLVPVTTKS